MNPIVRMTALAVVLMFLALAMGPASAQEPPDGPAVAATASRWRRPSRPASAGSTCTPWSWASRQSWVWTTSVTSTRRSNSICAERQTESIAQKN